MFRTLSVTRHAEDRGGPVLDHGVLAEALLFYRKVQVHGHENMLKGLITACTPEGLTHLASDGHLAFVYEGSLGGIRTVRERGIALHDPVSIKLQAPPLDRVVHDAFMAATNKPGLAKRLASRFLATTSEQAYTQSVLTDSLTDFADIDGILSTARIVLESLAPGYDLPAPLEFTVTNRGGQLQVATNIDLVAANKIYHQSVSPSHSSISNEYILSTVIAVREQMTSAALHSSEILVNEAYSRMIRRKIAHLSHLQSPTLNQAAHFQDVLFPDGKSIREVVQSGERTLPDVIRLLEKAAKWKDWLASLPESPALLRDYYASITKDSWVDSLPGKPLRWAFFTGLGLMIDSKVPGNLGTALGLGISAADTTFVERLLRGWRPHQFVEGPLRAFVTPPEAS